MVVMYTIMFIMFIALIGLKCAKGVQDLVPDIDDCFYIYPIIKF